MILFKQIVLLVLHIGFMPAFANDSLIQNLPNSDTMVIEYQPIGEFHTNLTPQTGAPRQGALEPDITGVIEIYQDFQKALKGLNKCEYIIVLYHLHLSKEWHSMVRPPNSNRGFGLFATRSPNRPNPIGLAVVKLDHIEEGRLHVSGIDAFDGTPVLDIKPWLPSIDCPGSIHSPKTEIENEVGLGKGMK